MSENVDKHGLIKQLTDLAIELGRTPTQREFSASCKRSGNTVIKYFGNFSTFVIAAGLDPVQRLKKVDNTIFNTSLESHLHNYAGQSPKLELVQEPFPLAGIISDIHWPFQKQRVVDRFVEYVGDEKPVWVIINGDGWDMFSHTKFPRSHNIFTPREEENSARQRNEEFWQKIKQVHPLAKCYQMLGNHDVRPLKRILETYPQAEDWIKTHFQKLFTFEGVTTLYDAREELFLNSQTLVFHGYRTKLGDHRDFTLYSTCNGHSHIGGVVVRNIRGLTLFELNSGYAGDPEAKGLTYTPQKITNWTHGFGAINKYGPQFISV